MNGKRSTGLVSSLIFFSLLLAFAIPANSVLLPFETTGDLYILDHSGNIIRITPDNQISVFLPEAVIGAVTGEGDAHFYDNGIAFDMDGNMYFTEDSSDSVLMWNSQTGVLSVLVSEDDITAVTGEWSADPEGLTVCNDRIYVVDANADSVLEIDPLTGDINVFVNESGFENLPGVRNADINSGIMCGDNGIVYVANEDSPDAIFGIYPNGTPFVLTADPVFNDLDVFMTRAPNGDIIIADNAGADTIYRVTPDGYVSIFLSENDLESVINADVDLEGGIAFDSQGYFYVAEENSGNILRFGPFGNGIGVSAINGNPAPVDGNVNGIIWVSKESINDSIGFLPDFEAGIAFAPVISNIPPTCIYFTNPSSSTPGQQVVFDASESYDPDGNIVYIEWLIDGKTVPNEIAFHTFQNPGTYRITLTAIDDDGLRCEKSFNYQVVAQPPVANFTYSPENPTPNQNVTFNASSSYDPDGMIVSYQWDFGDGTTASGVTVQHSYSQPGTYTVTLTVTDNHGLTASTSEQVTVTSIAPSSVLTRILPDTAEPGATIQVTITASVSSFGMEITETIPENFTFVNFTFSRANNVDINVSGNILTFTVVDLSIADGFTVTYHLQAPSAEGTYTFSGTYQSIGGSPASIGGDTTVTVTSQTQTGETVPDSINDTLEQLVSKYNPSFDWKTQTPSKDDVTQAVINAVMQYFTPLDDATKQEIVGDVVQLVMLYFSLGS